MNRKANVGIAGGLVVVFLAALVILGAGAFWYFGFEKTGSLTGSGIVAGAQCPDTKLTGFTPNVYNKLNTTGSENYDASWRLYYSDGTFVTSGTDTTAPTAVNIDCGREYVLRFLSADGDGGDNSRVLDVEGKGAKIIENGRAVSFAADGPTFAPSVYMSQHGVLEFRAWDANNNAYIYDTGDASATDYETDGVTFMSTTNNATAMAIGTSGEIDIKLDVRSTGTDTDFNDLGVYILVDASTSEYNEPSVRFDGVKLSDMKGQLDVFEARAWSGYEYVYFVDKSITDDGVSVDFNMKALAGVNPSSDVEIDFATRGASKETSGSNVRYSGVTDASSPAAVFAVQDVTLDIS